MNPIVAVVGRPNVGKSTLFNRLAGKPLAIVHDAPGVTRDRHYADIHIHGRDLTLIDTGGFDPTSDDPMGQGIARHVLAAIDEADVVVCVLDATAPPTGADAESVALLRRSRKPVLYVANKADTPVLANEAGDLYELGVGALIPVSALHGRGTGQLEAAIVAALPAREPAPEGEEPPEDELPRLALLGRPNAGKSSLFNYLCGAERSLIDDRPGTTRDPVDTRITLDGRDYLLIDTAGVRKKARVKDEVELASVMRALRTLDRADVVILMCDATEGLSDQDQRLLGLATERGRAIVVAMNKMDLLSAPARAKALTTASEQLHFARWAPILPCSALTGRGVPKLMAEVSRIHEEFTRRIGTSALNRFFEGVLERQPPPTSGGRAPRLFYLTQTSTRPPSFVVMASAPEHVRESYRRFVANQIREEFGFKGVPLRLFFRARRRTARGQGPSSSSSTRE